MFGGLVSLDATLYGAGDDPMDAVVMRDGPLNGLLHLADEYAQIRANWVGVEAAKLTGNQVGYRGIVASPSADEWYRIGEVARWPIQVRAGGTPYKVRLRIGGASDGTHTATFAAVITPTNWSGASWLGQSEDNVFITAGTASTSPAWLTGTSQGSAASGTLAALSARSGRAYQVPTSTLDDLGGNPAVANQLTVLLELFGKTSNTAGEARLHAVHASEYVG